MSSVPSAAMSTPGHYSVLRHECLSLLAPAPGRRYVDATFGGGGHTRLLLDAGASVIAYDRDPAALARADGLVSHFGADRLRLISQDFSALATAEEGNFDGVLFDLGLSSFQLDEADRGFSFRLDAPADMRMDPRQGIPASQWLETVDEATLVEAVRNYGEEPNWRRVVQALRSARGTGRLARTASLADLISAAIPARDRHTSKIHPATRTFQGIRIALNDEIGAIERALPAAFARLKSGGVLAVISFHSLEDRPVKHYFRQLCGQPLDANDSIPQQFRTKQAEPLTRKPILPSEAEVAENARSRSAKLRAVRKL